jgi:hypothetical protein
VTVILSHECLNSSLRAHRIRFRHARRVDPAQRVKEQDDLHRRLGLGGLSTELVKRHNLLRETFIQQLKILATQTGYWLSICLRHGDIEVNETLTFVEHSNAWVPGLLNLRGRCQGREFGPSAVVLRKQGGAQE